jgi:uncharacterized damage-inducible protein DinB
MTTDPRYPVGRFTYTPGQDRAEQIETIARLPEKMRDAIAKLDDAKLDTPYRAGGWTVRQVVHHVPDSHVNAYTRFKLAMTEDTPTIKPYDEAKWAELPDGRTGPLAPSLAMLEGVHARWVSLLRSMKPADFDRKLNHPENGLMTLDRMLGLYAWHSRHHLAHITELRKQKGW